MYHQSMTAWQTSCGQSGVIWGNFWWPLRSHMITHRSLSVTSRIPTGSTIHPLSGVRYHSLYQHLDQSKITLSLSNAKGLDGFPCQNKSILIQISPKFLSLHSIDINWSWVWVIIGLPLVTRHDLNQPWKRIPMTTHSQNVINRHYRLQ